MRRQQATKKISGVQDWRHLRSGRECRAMVNCSIFENPEMSHHKNRGKSATSMTHLNFTTPVGTVIWSSIFQMVQTPFGATGWINLCLNKHDLTEITEMMRNWARRYRSKIDTSSMQNFRKEL
jgi:hypothetical protein